jgi:hypothetical protein
VQNREDDTASALLTTDTALAVTTGTASPSCVLLTFDDFPHPPVLVTAASSFSVKGLGRLLGEEEQL